MLCVTIATSSTSGQDTQDPSRLQVCLLPLTSSVLSLTRPSAGTVRHADPTLISQHHPPKSKSLFNCSSLRIP